MKLVFPHDVPRLGVRRTFRHSRLAPLVTLVVVAAGTLAWTLAVPLGDDPGVLQWIPTLLGALMCLVLLIYVRKAFKPSNWLVKITEDGLFVKFRSYLNDGLPEQGPTIVHLPYAEIQRVQPGRRTLRLPERDSRVIARQLSFLDIDLGHEATTELAHALKAERALPPVRNGAAKHHDYPLRVIPPNRLRLEWKVRPGLRAAVDALEGLVPVDHDERKITLDWMTMDAADKEAMIVELAELGERMRARHLAEELYNLEKTEAKAYVDEIMGRTHQ